MFLYALSLIGFAVVVASSLGHQVQEIPTSAPFGLLGMLPIGYWAGLAIMLMSLALGLRDGNETLFFTQTALLFLSLWGAPSFFESYPSTWDSYMHYYSSVEIARSGAVPLDPNFAYAFNYPGFFVLSASYTLLGEPPALAFIRFYPLFAALVTIAAIYLFVRTYVPGTDYRLAFVIAAFANVWLQFNFSPQSLGLAAGLLVFVCLEREGLEWRLAAIGLFVFIVVAHPTTLVFVLGAVALKEIVGRFYRFVIARHRPIRWDRPWPIGAFILIWVAWLITGASSFSSNLAVFIWERLQYLGYVGEQVANQWQMRASPENILGPLYPQMRTAAVGLFIVATLVSLIIYLYVRKRSPAVFPKNILALFLLPFFIVPLDALFFNGQLYDRGILYLVLVAPIIFVPMFIGRAKPRLKVVLTAVALVVVVMAASTVFYQESLYISNDQSIAASTYMAEEVPPTYVVGGYYPYDVWSLEPEEYSRLKFNTAWGSNGESIANLTTYYGSGSYLFDETTELWYRQWGVRFMYDYYVDQAADYYRVYDNGAYWAAFSPRR